MGLTFFLVLQGLDDGQSIAQRCLAGLGQSQRIVDQPDTVVNTEDRVLLCGLFGNFPQPLLRVEDTIWRGIKCSVVGKREEWEEHLQTPTVPAFNL